MLRSLGILSPESAISGERTSQLKNVRLRRMQCLGRSPVIPKTRMEMLVTSAGQLIFLAQSLYAGVLAERCSLRSQGNRAQRGPSK